MASVLPTPTAGPYRLIRPIGAGGMGEVFLAHDPRLNRNIALKVLPPHLSSDAILLARLRHEARAASASNHPNIITIYDIGEMDGGAFIAMEFVEGKTLRELLSAGALPLRKALQIGAQIAEGLAAAHKRDLVHRDLKPENIMVTHDGVVKILDFGLAKSYSVPPPDSKTEVLSFKSDPGTIVGTYGYMAPEQARGEGVDYRGDQFALGAILYELVSGKRAFEGASGIETLFMIVRDEPVSLATFAAGTPAPLRWIIERCLAKDPDERYVATLDLARDLRQVRDHLSESGTSSPSVVPIVATSKRSRMALLTSLVVIAALAGALVTQFLRRPAPAPLRTERYLTYSGSDFSPAVSPDGKVIAFSSMRDGTPRIWVKQINGGGEVALTVGRDDFPRFSNDGASVLFVRTENGVGSLFRVAAVGGEARRLVSNSGTGEWSHDGKLLAFTRNRLQGAAQAGQLFLASADGSNPRLLADLPNNVFHHPRWSPDMKKIAAVAQRGRASLTIAIIDVEKKSLKMLSSPPKAGEVSSAVWSRDSKSLYYLRAESVEAVVGSSAKLIEHEIGSDQAKAIGWSSHNAVVLDALDNGQLVFDVRSPRDNLREIKLGADSAVEKWITRGNSSDRQPAYSPDGRSILFTSNRSGNLDLWVIDNDTGAVKRVTDDAAEDWDPGFTPDGKQIVWSSGRSGNLEIWIANVDGTEARQLSKDGFDAENPSVTRDGWVIYNSFHPQKAGVWKVRVDGTEARPIVIGRTAIPEVSPDGSYVAFLYNARTNQQILRIVSVADGKAAAVFAVQNLRRTAAILGRSRWMPDGKSIAFLGQNDAGVNGVYVQDFVPGRNTDATRRELAGFDADRATESFGIAPNGSAITVAGWEQLFSLFALEGLPDLEVRQKATSREGGTG